MPKRFNLLVLGPQTTVGQAILKKLSDHFHYLNILVPTGIYGEGVVLPPYQVYLNFYNVEQLSTEFALCDVIVSCSPSYSTSIVRKAVENSGGKFIDACFSYPQAVIEAAFHRLPFSPKSMEAVQSASGISIPDFWAISHAETSLPKPMCDEGNWYIEQTTVSLSNISVRHRIAFSSRFFAYLFWCFSIISRVLFPLFGRSKAYTSLSKWTFIGKCYEHNQKFHFVASSDRVDAESLRPDVAVMRIIENLGINRSESHDWGCCGKLKVKLVEYKGSHKQ